MIIEQPWRDLSDKIAIVERGVEIGHIRLGIEQSRRNGCDFPAGKESIIKGRDSGALIKYPCRDTRDILTVLEHLDCRIQSSDALNRGQNLRDKFRRSSARVRVNEKVDRINIPAHTDRVYARRSVGVRNIY